MATTQKTLPTDASVTDFLARATPEKRRVDGERLATVFREVTGAEPVMWGPTMVGYGSFRYVSPVNPRTTGVWPKVAFSPRKAQLSLYGLKDHAEGAALLPALGTYTEGVGCVYVRRLEDIDEDVLRRLIAIAWEQTVDQGADGSASDDALPRIGRPATDALAAIGVTTASALSAFSERQLLHGVGPKAVRLIREAGIALRGD